MQRANDQPFRKQPSELTEEEALALFESTARDLLRLSGAGFLVKLKREEFSPLEQNPHAMRVAELIPDSFSMR